MGITSTLNRLTTPTSAAAAGALIGAATLYSWSGAAVSSFAAVCLPSRLSPRERLLSALAFATIKSAVDHLLPNQPALSICTALLPVLGRGSSSVKEIVLTTFALQTGIYALSIIKQSDFLIPLCTITAMAVATGVEHSWRSPQPPQDPRPAVDVDPADLIPYLPNPPPAPQRPRASFADGIPAHLENDRIFRLFKCAHTGRPICFHPFSNGNTIFEGPYSYEPGRMHLQKLKALIDDRKRFYEARGLNISYTLPDIGLLVEALNELHRICPNARCHWELERLVDDMHETRHEPVPLQFDVDDEDYSNNSPSPEPIRAPAQADQWTITWEGRGKPIRCDFGRKSCSFDLNELINLPAAKALIQNHKVRCRFFDITQASDLWFFEDALLRLGPILPNTQLYRELRAYAEQKRAELASIPISVGNSNNSPSSSKDIWSISWGGKGKPIRCYLGRIRCEFILDELIHLPAAKALIQNQKGHCGLDVIDLYGSDVWFFEEALLRLGPIFMHGPLLLEINELANQRKPELVEKLANQSMVEWEGNSNNSPLPPLVPVQGISFTKGIPTSLHGDTIFSLAECPLSGSVTSDCVLDPTDLMTIYDRNAVVTWFEKQESSPTTRLPLREEQLIEIPAFNRLIAERVQFYTQHSKGLSELEAAEKCKNVSPDDLKVLKEALKELESRAPTSEACSMLHSIVLRELSFADGIPPEFYDDCIFKLFIDPFTNKPILDFRLDPTDRKTLYEAKSIETYLKNFKISPATGKPITERLIALPKLNALVQERKRFFIRLIAANMPRDEIEKHKSTLPDRNMLKEAAEELKKLSENSDLFQKLNNLLEPS